MKMNLKLIGKLYDKIINMRREFYRRLALKMVRKAIIERRPEKTKFGNLLRFCFRVSVYAIILGYLISKRYKYYLENDPQFLRE